MGGFGDCGYAFAPIFVYLGIAHALEIAPGVLLGPDAAGLEVSDSEMVLLRALREVGVAPHEAILRLVRPGRDSNPRPNG